MAVGEILTIIKNSPQCDIEIIINPQQWSEVEEIISYCVKNMSRENFYILKSFDLRIGMDFDQNFYYWLGVLATHTSIQKLINIEFANRFVYDFDKNIIYFTWKPFKGSWNADKNSKGYKYFWKFFNKFGRNYVE